MAPFTAQFGQYGFTGGDFTGRLTRSSLAQSVKTPLSQPPKCSQETMCAYKLRTQPTDSMHSPGADAEKKILFFLFLT